LLCDSEIYTIVRDGESVTLNAYRTSRLATPAQRAALAALYPTCPCCDTAFWRCEIHHLDPWGNDNGNTNLDRLLPVCTRLHHLVHDQHWRIELLPDRTIRLYRPDGTEHRLIPPPRARTDPNAA
jgi:hypothetical protein